MFCFWLYSTRTPAQTRVCSHFLNLRTSSWQLRLSLMTSAETWDNSDVIWQVRDVSTVIFICSSYSSLNTCKKHRSQVMNENTVHDIGWLHIHGSEQTGGDHQYSCWLAVRNSLLVVILLCVFIWKPQPVCVTLSLWFLEVPTDQTSAQSGIIFPQTPPSSHNSPPWFPITGPSRWVTVYT